MAANYESEITKFEDGQEERSRIYMNHPLRHKGYTLFQESFQEYPDGTQYSQLAVWRNPADQWPLYSCIVMSVGLLFHMVQKLLKYMKVESERRAA
jgi:cytochrome c biogenesis protein ResB